MLAKISERFLRESLYSYKVLMFFHLGFFNIFSRGYFDPSQANPPLAMLLECEARATISIRVPRKLFDLTND